MNNKVLAIIGIGTYILDVYSTTTDLNNVSSVHPIVLIISGVLSAAFTVIATIRLWKINRIVACFFAVTSVVRLGSLLMGEIQTDNDGNTLTLLINVIKILGLLAFFWAIVVLWRSSNKKEIRGSQVP